MLNKLINIYIVMKNEFLNEINDEKIFSTRLKIINNFFFAFYLKDEKK